MTIDRNLYYADNGGHLILYGCPWRPKYKVFDSLNDFTSPAGFDAYSKSAVPGFVNIGVDNYRLKPGSPALKK